MSHMRLVPQQYQELVSELVPGLDCGYDVYDKLRFAYSALCIGASNYYDGTGSAQSLELARIRFRNLCLVHNLGDEGVL